MKQLIIYFSLLCSTVTFAQQLKLSDAKVIAEKAEKYATKKGWHITIAIVNAENNLIYFQRDESAYSGSIEAALAKAKSANSFQRSTSSFVQGLKDGRAGLVTVPGIVAIEGGLPITSGKVHMGAIGISGAKSTEDEEVAAAALEKNK